MNFSSRLTNCNANIRFVSPESILEYLSKPDCQSIIQSKKKGIMPVDEVEKESSRRAREPTSENEDEQINRCGDGNEYDGGSIHSHGSSFESGVSTISSLERNDQRLVEAVLSALTETEP